MVTPDEDAILSPEQYKKALEVFGAAWECGYDEPEDLVAHDAALRRRLAEVEKEIADHAEWARGFGKTPDGEGVLLLIRQRDEARRLASEWRRACAANMAADSSLTAEQMEAACARFSWETVVASASGTAHVAERQHASDVDDHQHKESR